MAFSLAAAYDELTAIVGARNAFTATDSTFADYLHDETFLRGDASLVLRPANAGELAAIVQTVARLRDEAGNQKKDLSLTLRGGGSGLSGACVPQRGVVLDLTQLNRILDIDAHNGIVHAECGLILGELSAHLTQHGLWYPVDPSSAAICTIGGSIATNAAGPSSLKYGTTRAHLATATLVDARGNATEFGSLPVKTSMGFPVTQLLCGSEGRLGIIQNARLRLMRLPEETALAMASFVDEQAAVEFILTLRNAGIQPRAIELIDRYSASLVNFPLSAGVVLMIELDGNAQVVGHDLVRLTELSGQAEWVSARDEKNRRELWARRKDISPRIRQKFAFRLGEDVAVPLTQLAQVCRYARKHAAARGVEVAIWGHAGDGNLHINYLFSEKGQLPLLDSLMPELAREVTRLGGAMSGEHGLGRLKQKYARAILPVAYFDIQARIKSAFDADMLFNPALEGAP